MAREDWFDSGKTHSGFPHSSPLPGAPTGHRRAHGIPMAQYPQRPCFLPTPCASSSLEFGRHPHQTQPEPREPVAEHPYLLWHAPNIDLRGIRASLSVKAQFSKGNVPESIPHQAATASKHSAQENKGRITGSWQKRGVTALGGSRSCGLPVFLHFLEREYRRWSLQTQGFFHW